MAKRAIAGRYFHGIERDGRTQFRTAPCEMFRASETRFAPPSDLMSLLDMTALSQIVGPIATPNSHSLCVELFATTPHFVTMDLTDKNGGPNHLRAWRIYRKMTQECLAALVGTTANMIQYLETGERGLSAKWLRRLAPALDTTPGMLLDHDPTQVDSDLLDFWANANERTKRQLSEVAKAIVRSGTDG